MNIVPITRIRGTVHTSSARTVEAYAGRPEERDPATGALVRRAMEPRPAYDVIDVTVLTEQGGGFAQVLMKPEDLQLVYGGALPERGTEVDWPIRTYLTWAGREGNRFRVVGFSVASDVFQAEHAAATGKRSAEPISA